MYLFRVSHNRKKIIYYAVIIKVLWLYNAYILHVNFKNDVNILSFSPLKWIKTENDFLYK